MTWEIIPLGDQTKLGNFAKMMGDIVPSCGFSKASDIERYMKLPVSLFEYSDKDHSIILGFIHSNGNDMWCISYLAFEGPLDKSVYKKVHDGIVQFMDEKKLDRVYAVPPKLSPDDKMQKFYDRIRDKTYWKIEINHDPAGNEFWVLPREGEVEING